MAHLPAGTRLGSYETLALLGAGGMGEVYRARDTRLGRTVAIKVLPDSFTLDAERVSRFLREAQLLASLNHPHIATIYGLEDWTHGHFIVLELVDGGTLAERLASGPLSWHEAMGVARQLVDALQAAHEKGIVHRDLKPANLGFGRDGDLKVLDFGLAKPASPEASAGHSNSPTIATDTQLGTILGTAAYLSPEQARGLSVDRRADIWAFGCVMFEMLTGTGPFGGATTLDIIANILQREPDWSMLPRDVPAPLKRLLRRCLEKDARRRLQDIADAGLYLEDTLDPVEDAAALPQLPPPVTRNVEFRRLTDFSGAKETPAISPDGRMLVFVAMTGGRRQLWLRLIAGGAALQLTRDDVGHEHPRWAPDSNTLFYYTPPGDGGEQGTIWEVAALGGWPRMVAPSVGGAAVSPDGRRLALLQLAGEQLALMTVARDGSASEQLSLLPVGFTYTSLRWSPEGQRIAFQRSSGSGFADAIEIVTISDGRRRDIVHATSLTGFAWLPDGSGFVYSSSHGSTLLYPPVTNLRTVRVDGSGDRPLTFGDASYAHPDVHASGMVLATRIRSRSDVWRFPIGGPPAENTRDGERVTLQTGHVQTPSVSPDGTEIVYISDNGGHANLWIGKTNGSGSRQVTFETGMDSAIGIPTWSPRGDLIAFLLSQRERTAVCVIRSDGGGFRQIAHAWAPCWSADGRWLYYWRLDGSKTLEKTPIDGGAAVPVRREPDFILPAFAPDGSGLYYAAHVGTGLLGSWRPGAGEIRRAQPEDGPSQLMVRLPRDRIPGRFRCILNVTISPDGRWLALPLLDGVTTNIWGLPTAGGELTRFTDFGDRPIDIERAVSWSSDSRSLYAAVAEGEMDIVLLDGLLG